MIDKNLLLSAAQGFGIDVTDEEFVLLDKFSELVVSENKKYNLTAITDPVGFTEKHIIDSIAALPVIPYGASVCDVGCGAGFPSFPIALLRQDTKVTAMDSTSKKVVFVNSAAKSLGVGNITAVCERAEECIRLREKFDVVCARAVSSLNVLLEVCTPLVKVGGIFIAYKSNSDELIESENAAKIMKVALKDKISFSLPSGDNRVLMVFEKTAHTPPDYPRRYSLIKKAPL